MTRAPLWNERHSNPQKDREAGNLERSEKIRNPGSIIYETSPVLILEQVIAGKERLPDCDCLWLGKIWVDITNMFVKYLPDFIWFLYFEHIFRCIKGIRNMGWHVAQRLRSWMFRDSILGCPWMPGLRALGSANDDPPGQSVAWWRAAERFDLGQLGYHSIWVLKNSWKHGKTWFPPVNLFIFPYPPSEEKPFWRSPRGERVHDE